MLVQPTKKRMTKQQKDNRGQREEKVHKEEIQKECGHGPKRNRERDGISRASMVIDRYYERLLILDP